MNKDKILVVDDEENILSSLHRLMRKEFDLTTTTSPAEALSLLKEGRFAVLLSDQRMPDMTGTELMGKARLIAPDTRRIILTGQADTQAAMEAINRGAVYRFLTKPWNDLELVGTIRQAVQHYDLEQENRRLQALTEAQNARLAEFNETLTQKVFLKTRQVTELNEALRSSFRGSTKVLAQLAEMHSSVLGNHAQRVAKLAKHVGERLGLSEKELHQLEVAATLHDIGKIGMDPRILAKSRTMTTPKERAVLLAHAVRGAALVQMMPNFGEAAVIIRHHHENFDGTGYPDRLEAEKIPLGARIIAVVNAYDNVLNMRDSFSEMTPEEALRRVRAQSVRAFDPEIVDMLALCLLTEASEVQQEREVQVSLDDLLPGMVLSRDLITSRGVLLLQKDRMIEEHHIPRLLKHNEADPIVDGIYMYRKAPTAVA